jgi:hypothetical protein
MKKAVFKCAHNKKIFDLLLSDLLVVIIIRFRGAIMDETLKKVLFYLGLVVALFLFFYFILPIIVKILIFVFKAIFYIFIWGAIALVVILFVAHIVKIIRREI